MREKIYTIPVNEVFDEHDKCPFCLLYSKLEKIETDLITGASMMEPDVRALTNEKGFCRHHFDKMCELGKKLPIALTLQSHIDTLRKEITPSGVFVKDGAERPIKRIEKLENQCYICDRIEANFEKMIETACLLFEDEREFREKVTAQKYFCLPHYRRFLEISKKVNSKKQHPELVKSVSEVMTKYIDSLYEDISLFCKKFDYNYRDLPWGNSKDSVERTINLLTGEDITL